MSNDNGWRDEKAWPNERIVEGIINTPIVDNYNTQFTAEFMAKAMPKFIEHGIISGMHLGERGGPNSYHMDWKIGEPLAWRQDEQGRTFIKAGILDTATTGMRTHDENWELIKAYQEGYERGQNGAPAFSISGIPYQEANEQVCDEEKCWTRFNEGEVLAVAFVGDEPGNTASRITAVNVAARADAVTRPEELDVCVKAIAHDNPDMPTGQVYAICQELIARGASDPAKVGRHLLTFLHQNPEPTVQQLRAMAEGCGFCMSWVSEIMRREKIGLEAALPRLHEVWRAMIQPQKPSILEDTMSPDQTSTPEVEERATETVSREEFDTLKAMVEEIRNTVVPKGEPVAEQDQPEEVPVDQEDDTEEEPVAESTAPAAPAITEDIIKKAAEAGAEAALKRHRILAESGKRTGDAGAAPIKRDINGNPDIFDEEVFKRHYRGAGKNPLYANRMGN